MLPPLIKSRHIVAWGSAAASGGDGATIGTGKEDRESLKDGREIWIDGGRVEDVATHAACKPIVEASVWHAPRSDIFHVSANTDPKGDRSKRAQGQDRLVKETDKGIVVRGAKFETAAGMDRDGGRCWD